MLTSSCFEQIDLDVLQELPTELRRQVELEYQLKSKTDGARSVQRFQSEPVLFDDVADVDGAKPGCLDWAHTQEDYALEKGRVAEDTSADNCSSGTFKNNSSNLQVIPSFECSAHS